MNELRHGATKYGRGRIVSSAFFGGGTPSITPDLVASLISTTKEQFEVTDGIEITSEANPCDRAEYAKLRAAGVNRLSIGVQALDDDMLKKLGRRHTGTCYNYFYTVACIYSILR